MTRYKEYHIIDLIESKGGPVYDLLSEEEFESKSNDFWEIWNSLAFEVDLNALHKACKKRKIPTTGLVVPFSSGSGFDNFTYKVKVR